MENDFLAAYMEGRKRASQLKCRIESCRKLMEELQNSLEPGMIEISTDPPIIWRLNISGEECSAIIAVGLEYYALNYLPHTVWCSDIPELRAAILGMIIDPRMH
jgi:hypothetical protein